MSVIGSNVLAGASGGAGAAGFAIERSLRFNSGDSPRLDRTPSAAGNRRTWTWSGWVKRSNIGAWKVIFSGAGSSNNDYLAFEPSDRLTFDLANSGSGRKLTTRVFRDLSAFYHIVLAVDYTSATANDRIKIYINGVLEDTFDANAAPSQNHSGNINNNTVQRISGVPTNIDYFDGYLADVHFIDGQALAATDFGETNTDNLWVPKAFSGTYTTAESGTTSPFVFYSEAPGYQTIANINSGSGPVGVDNASGGYIRVKFDSAQTSVTTIGFVGGAFGSGQSFEVLVNGSSVATKTVVSGWGADSITISSTDITEIEFRTASSGYALGQLTFNGTSVPGTPSLGTPASGTNSFHLDFADNSSNAALGTDTSGNSNTWTVNNITASAPGLATANQGMDVVTYTGNGGTQSISNLAFQPDFVWCKGRSFAGANMLFDSVRGATKRLVSNQNLSEGTVQGVTSFNSNGFTLGSDADCNYNGQTHVAWCWRAGGAASSNTSGTITSSVSANNTYGFSIVKYTGNNTNSTIGHGLGATAKFIITKKLTDTGEWYCYHVSLGATKYIRLNQTDGSSTYTLWNDTAPTSSVFSVSTSNDANKTGEDFIAYCWSEVAGFSKISSYTGTGAAGVVVTTGFKPRFILIKNVSTGSDWRIFDTARSPSNPADKLLFPNASDAEKTNSAYNTDITATGFTVNGTHSGLNTNGDTYIYAAFAAKPNGEGVDSLVDTPTNGATASDTGLGNQITGNYATWNPLTSSASTTFSNGNLDFACSAQAGGFSTIGVTSGKWYFEVTAGSLAVNTFIGVFENPENVFQGYFEYQLNGGTFFTNVGGSGTYTSGAVEGDVVGIAVDIDNGTLQVFKNGTSLGTATGGSLSGKTWFPGIFSNAAVSNAYSINFGQRAFSNSSVPSGYKALCTSNLPEPTIADGSKYFDTIIASGTGASKTFTMPGGFGPGLVWAKQRNGATNHALFDVVRGATKRLVSNATQAEDTQTNQLSAFTSDGFTYGSDIPNASGNTGVYWAWDAGSSTVSNTDGTITSQVRAQPSAGFSIVGWSGQSGTNTVGHGLNAAPELIILKGRTNAGAWVVGSDYIGWGNRLELNGTGAASSASTDFNSTAPTSSVFTAGSNQSSGNKIAYCFSSVDQYSSVGSYTGNGSSDGPFIHTGFKVAFLLTKRTDTSENWEIRDIRRNPFNRTNRALFPHTSGTEDNGSVDFDFLSNGFKLRNVNGSTNANGGTYIYYAVAANPFQANGGLAR